MINCTRRLRAVAVGTIALVLTAATARALTALPAAWKNWHYSRAIDLAPTDAPRLVQTVIADAIYLRANPKLNDLRIIDAQGNETPYTIFTLDGATKLEHLTSTIHERSFTPGEFTQAVIEIKGDAPFHNSLEIETNEQNFIEWVSVDASDDARTWRIVQDRTPIFRFAKDGRQGTRVVHYSENNARYLRVRILDGEKVFPVSGAAVLHETGGPEERLPLDGLQITPDTRPQQRKSIWTADLGGIGPPVTEVTFDVPPMEFIRSVDLSASDDGKAWRNFASGQIYRFHQGDKVQEQLKVPISFGGQQSRYWRITIENGNDAPLPVAAVRLYTTPRRMVFEQQPGQTYSLLYGQERAQAPQYDLGRRVDRQQQEQAIMGRLGSEETNSAWVDPNPWTETHEIFLWAALIVAVLLIGFTAIQSLRRNATTNTGAR